MKTQYRAILAIVLSAAFFILYYTVINPPKPTPQGPEQTAEQTKDQAQAQASQVEPGSPEELPTASSLSQDPQAGITIQTAKIRNDLVEMEITNDGGVLTSWKVLEYHESTDKASPRIDLAASDPTLPAPLALMLEDLDISLPDKLRYEIVETKESSAALRWRGKGLEIVKTISMDPGSYVANVAVDIKNLSNKAITPKPALVWSGFNEKPPKRGFFSFLRVGQVDVKKPVYYVDGKAHRGDIAKTEEVSIPGGVYWAGIESRYFISSIIPRIQGEGLAVQYASKALADKAPGATGLWAGVVEPTLIIPPGETGKAAFSVYSGPKDIERLKALGVNMEKAIDYGWFTIIAVPILYLLKFFYSIIHNYGVAIILLTIFVKLLLHPINVRSLKSMKAMQQLQPRLKELQKKYKGDKQRINQETMQLFRSHKVNPMGGCLPMVLQLPIYIALYKVLWNSIELFHAPFFWFYKDLSAPDPYMITPILLGVFMVAQQMLMPSASTDPAQKKMMMLMPVMFTVFMIFLPVGLVLYILVNTATSVTQQWMYNKGIGLMDLVRGKWKMKAAMV
ncbi:MAG: membrane protein insertase YidC [Pseudomonadota bacterium]